MYAGADYRVGKQRGRALTVILAVVVVAGACAVLGFYIGRNVLGEQYLKRSAIKPRVQPAPSVARPMQAPDQPVIDEPPALDESPRARRRPPRALPERPAAPEPTARARDAASRRPSPATLQLGSFLDPDNAKNLVQDLQNRGYSPRVTVQKEGQSTVHKVTMGPLSSERARDLAADLQREGYQVNVIGGE